MLHQINSQFCQALLIFILLAISVWQPSRTQVALANTNTIHVVTSSMDDNTTGTFRSALAAAKIGDTIIFDPAVFPSHHPLTITMQTALPAIQTDNLTIDASQAGVVLSGQQLISGNGLEIDGASGVAIRGLQILYFPDNGIKINNGAQNTIIGGVKTGYDNVISANGGSGLVITGADTISNTIQGNLIGTDHSGTKAMGNQGNGIWIDFDANHNWIGGESIGSGNLISANRGQGIFLGTTFENHVLGNRIGVDITGQSALGNVGDGIALQNGAHHNWIGGIHSVGYCDLACNLISGNEGRGIYLQSSSANLINTYANVIQGNWVGVNSEGITALGNQGEAGIALRHVEHTLIGGSVLGQGNLISGNYKEGIRIVSGSKNQILGNLIGVNVSGKRSLPNAWNGIKIEGTQQNIIGGNRAEKRNIISGNRQNGLVASGVGQNQILGNFIGVDISGLEPLGNGFTGLILFDGVQNRIGGNESGEGNIISANGSIGIVINSDVSVDNQLIGNYVGIGVDGIVPLGNGSDGIAIMQGASRNLLRNNLVRYNRGIALRLTLGNKLENNNFEDNRYNFAQVTGGTLVQEEEQWDVQGNLNTYIVTNHNITIPSGQAWSINAGVTVQFDFGKGATVAGTLTTSGTITQPVKLTSSQRFAAPLPGDWLGITFQPGSQGQFHFTSVEFAGEGITVDGGHVQLTNSTVAASQQTGIWLKNGVVTFHGENSLAGNSQWGLRNDSANPIQATNVWWGSASGPHMASNPNGHGDAVSAQVVALPYLTDPGPKNDWRTAPVLLPGDHAFTIQKERDVQWFRIPVSQRDGALMATLRQLPRDYDLFLFRGLEQVALVPKDTAHVQSIDQPQETAHVQSIPGQAQLIEGCSPTYLGQVADLGQIDALGNLLMTSCQHGNTPEQVNTGIWDQSGWYYLLVAGHNGVFASTQPYTLSLQLTIRAAAINAEIPTFTPPTEIDQHVQTVILTHRQRLLERYPLDQVNGLLEELNNLAVQPTVTGKIIDLGNFAEAQKLATLYQRWDNEPQNVARANQVADGIKALLISLRSAYPALTNLVLVGGDEIIPFRRIPDETTIANEQSYQAFAQANSPLAAAFQNRYLFSDNYYASFNPIPWRGRELALPTYAIGRLVETPTEISANLSRFIQQPIITINSTLVVGYDFLRDQANAIARDLQGIGVNPNQLNTLIHDSWDADTLRRLWLTQRQDVSSINGHFDHYRAIPAAEGRGEISPAEISQSQHLSGTLIFSVGCHSGLSVAQNQATAQDLDFAQALVGKGATYLANTGYGYGDANAIGYSERLMQLFAQHLADSTSVGQALVRAKVQYFNELGVQSMTPYDEKILNVATLYGLPMLGVQLLKNEIATSASNLPNPWQVSPPNTCNENSALSCRHVSFTPTFEFTSTADGLYYNVVGEAPQIVTGQPIQPRASVSVTLPLSVAHGVLFEGGLYSVTSSFNPVIASLITQTKQLANGQQIPEPSYPHTHWRPTVSALINTARTSTGRQQRLVVLPAQYRATTQDTGILRRFHEMNFTIYYSTSRDIIAPYIWSVQYHEQENGSLQVQVHADDISQVERVVITYTTGNGIWHTKNLEKFDPQSPWQGELLNQSGLEFFVQAVDNAGNVAFDDNRGDYFAVTRYLFLPTIFR